MLSIGNPYLLQKKIKLSVYPSNAKVSLVLLDFAQTNS